MLMKALTTFLHNWRSDSLEICKRDTLLHTHCLCYTHGIQFKFRTSCIRCSWSVVYFNKRTQKEGKIHCIAKLMCCERQVQTLLTTQICLQKKNKIKKKFCVELEC